MDEESNRWLYSLELTSIYAEGSSLEDAERKTARIFGDVFYASGTPFHKLGHASLRQLDLTSDLSLAATRIGVEDLEIADANQIVQRLQQSTARHTPDNRTSLEITARPDSDTEISPLTITLGLNESAWLAPNSSASRNFGVDLGILASTTCDLVNFHLLVATIADPNLDLIDLDELIEDLIEASDEYRPTIRADMANDCLVLPPMDRELLDEGLLKRTDLWLSTFEEPTFDQLYAYLGFITAVVADHWPLVARATTKSFYDDDTVETKVYIDGQQIAEWSAGGIGMDGLGRVGVIGGDAFGPFDDVPEGHMLHISGLPRTNMQMSLLTMAIRHAEIHVLGTPFTSQCKAWEEAIHAIADLIRSDLADLPKWRGLFEDE